MNLWFEFGFGALTCVWAQVLTFNLDVYSEFEWNIKMNRERRRQRALSGRDRWARHPKKSIIHKIDLFGCVVRRTIESVIMCTWCCVLWPQWQSNWISSIFTLLFIHRHHSFIHWATQFDCVERSLRPNDSVKRNSVNAIRSPKHIPFQRIRDIGDQLFVRKKTIRCPKFACDRCILTRQRSLVWMFVWIVESAHWTRTQPSDFATHWCCWVNRTKYKATITRTRILFQFLISFICCWPGRVFHYPFPYHIACVPEPEIEPANAEASTTTPFDSVLCVCDTWLFVVRSFPSLTA